MCQGKNYGNKKIENVTETTDKNQHKKKRTKEKRKEKEQKKKENKCRWYY